MTFPAIVQATEQPIAGAAALVAGILIARRGGGLITVAASCCGVAFVAELLLGLLPVFPAKAVACLTGIRYDQSTMLYREKAAARRLFLCEMQIVRLDFLPKG